MNPTLPQATPAPLHDIAGPVSFFPYPIWMVVLAAIAAIAVLGLVIWGVTRLIGGRERELTSRERARRALADLRNRMATADVYEFGIQVSDVLRRYIEETRGLRATRQTSIEFLAEVENRADFSADQRAALARFLEIADLIKYARVHAGPEESRILLDNAEGVLEWEAAPPADQQPVSTEVRS